MNRGEHGRHEDQGRHGGEDQAADDGSAERCVLFTAIAHAEGHGQHADDHRERRHQHGPKAGKASVVGGLQGRGALVQPVTREAHDQNAVRGGNPHTHDGPGQRWHAQRRTGYQQHPGDAGYRGRQGLYEIMTFDDEMRDLVIQHASTQVLRMEAKKRGMRTLRSCGLMSIYDGVTTIEEVVRETIVEHA